MGCVTSVDRDKTLQSGQSESNDRPVDPQTSGTKTAFKVLPTDSPGPTLNRSPAELREKNPLIDTVVQPSRSDLQLILERREVQLVEAAEKNEKLTKDIAELKEKLDSFRAATAHLETKNGSLQKKVKSLEAEKLTLQKTRSDPQLIADLLNKITALEEYCLNVDHHNIPVPEKLQYLFTKTQGTYERTNFSYKGQLIRGVPSGMGTAYFPNGMSHEGQYVNGIAHGAGIIRDPTAGYEIHGTYKYGNLDGISTRKDSDGSRKSDVYCDGVKEHVSKIKYNSRLREYVNMRSDRPHGHKIIYYTTEDYIVVYTYDAGEKQGKGKKYTYKEQVD